MVPKYYKNASEETCLVDMTGFFEKLTGLESVKAQLYYKNSTGNSLPYDKVTDIYNHLNSSKSWSHVSEWDVEVEYTIPHPDGDVVAVDTNTLESAYLTRRTVSKVCTGYCEKNKEYCFSISRVESVDIDQLNFNTTLFSKVRILKSKRFHYQTARSSWTFRISMAWEGETKREAENSEKKYFVFVETNDTLIASMNPSYTIASFMEKIIDVISVPGDRQVLFLGLG